MKSLAHKLSALWAMTSPQIKIAHAPRRTISKTAAKLRKCKNKRAYRSRRVNRLRRG